MNTPAWDVVLFDLDGTVVNSIPLILASYDFALRDVLGTPRPLAERLSWIGRTLVDTFGTVAPEHADALVRSYTEWNLAHTDELMQGFDGMAELLADLRTSGVTTGVVTSKRLPSARRSLAALGLGDSIDLVTTMEDTAVHKPDPAPLLDALDKLGRRPEDAVYVGDAVVDLRCAHAARCDAIAVTWGAGRREDLAGEQPVAVVDELDALRALLLGA